MHTRRHDWSYFSKVVHRYYRKGHKKNSTIKIDLIVINVIGSTYSDVSRECSLILLK